MIEHHKKKAMPCILIGALLMISVGLSSSTKTLSLDSYELEGMFLSWVLFAILYLYGCFHLVKGKGYSGWFTIIGCLALPGLLILLLLKDKTLQKTEVENN